jgi:hypothetical protein
LAGASALVEAGSAIGVGKVNDKMEEEYGQPVRAEGAGQRLRGAEWFEDLLGGSSSGPLGRISRLGVRQSQGDGRRVVEWEIVEWSTADREERSATPGGKRKIGEAGMPEV